MDEKINATNVIHTIEDKKRTSLIDVFNVAEITETLKALQGEREDDLKEIHRSWIDNAVYDILKENKYAPYDILDVDFEPYSFIDSTVVSASLNDLTASIVFGITKEIITLPNQETLEPAFFAPFELLGVTGGNALCCAGDTTGQLLVLFSNQALLVDFNGEGSTNIYTIPQENYIGVAYAGGSWVAITSDGKIYRSVNNGETWDLVTTFQVGFTDITSNGTNTFFAVSNSGNSYFSTDNGVTWTLQTMRDYQWSGIGYFEVLETYIACSIDGKISIWDRENAEWAIVNSDILKMEMRAVACSKDVVVIVGKGDKCIASYDGINWETVKIPNAVWTTISRDKDFFYVFSEDGKVARSATGGITGIMFASLDEVDKGEEVGKSIAPNVLKQVTDRYLLLAGGEMTGTLVSQNIELKGNISSNKEETTITMFQSDGKQTSEIKTSGTDNRLFQITQVNADDTISMIELNGETGKINIINDLDVAGNTEVGNDLTVTGNITAGNDLNVNGNLTVSGSTTLNGNLFAGGSENTIGGSKTTIDSDTVEINNPTTVNSNLTVENDLTIGNNLTVEGSIENSYIVKRMGGIGGLDEENNPTQDLNDIRIQGMYRCNSKMINMPPNLYGGDLLVIFGGWTISQILISGNNYYYRTGSPTDNTMTAYTWNEWKTVITNTDLQNKLDGKLDKTGGTVSGNLTVNGTIANTDLQNKLNAKFDKTGGTISGNLTVNGTTRSAKFVSKVGLPNPTDATSSAGYIFDSDTGMFSNGDGILNFYANNVERFKIFGGTIAIFGNLTVTGTCSGDTFIRSIGDRLNQLGYGVSVETYRSGGSWYRVWSDGWIEQGGEAETMDRTITFLKKFKDTSYILHGIGFVIDSIGAQYLHTKSTTGFSTHSHVKHCGTLSWYACGY